MNKIMLKNTGIPLLFMLIFSLNASVFGQAPGRLHVFSENGERFFLYINGKLQNASLSGQVTTKDIAGEGCVMRIVFDDPNLGTKNFDVPINPGKQVSIMLRKNKKGEMSMRYAGESDVPTEPTDASPQQFSQTQTPENQKNAPIPTEKRTQTQTQTIDIQIDNQQVRISSTHPETEDTEYNPTGCNTVSTSDFNQFILQLKSLTTEDERYAAIIKLNNAYCLYTHQIKEQMLQLFTDKRRLGLVRFSHSSCPDKENYNRLKSAFQTTEAMAEFQVFLDSKK